MHVLIADDDVGDLIVFRRLLRDTPYLVQTVRSAGQALALMEKQEFAVVIADDERLPDRSGADLLVDVKRSSPGTLRILLSRPERAGELAEAARADLYHVVARPFFAQPVVQMLAEHAARRSVPAPPPEDTLRRANPFLGEETPAPGRMAQRRLLLTMAELVEAKAGYSSGHGARVSALCGVLGREAGLSGEDLDALVDAALVHDVGELAIDPGLLQHEGPLGDEEQKIVRAHVESGHKIVRRAGLPEAVLGAVRHHHERVDGKGYPDGLHGELIPLPARIIAVADTWDALATDRPYRHAAPPSACVRELAQLSGTQLDAQLVAIYLDRKLYELIDWSDPPRPGLKLA